MMKSILSVLFLATVAEAYLPSSYYASKWYPKPNHRILFSDKEPKEFSLKSYYGKWEPKPFHITIGAEGQAAGAPSVFAVESQDIKKSASVSPGQNLVLPPAMDEDVVPTEQAQAVVMSSESANV